MRDPRSKLDRRRFLVGLAVLAGGGAALVGLWFHHVAGPSRRVRARAERLFLSYFPEPEAIRPLGESYLEAHPGEADHGRLIELVLDELGVVEELGTDRAFGLRISALVRADFAAGRTLRLQGWIVSRTECRLAALVAEATPSPVELD